MSLKQCKAVAEVLFKEEPVIAKRFKEVICELCDEGFAEEKVGDLYEAFISAWIEHTRPKKMLSLEGQKERQRLYDEHMGS